MYKSFVNILKCPICRSTNLFVQSLRETEDQIRKGVIHCSACKMKFPIIDGIPLLVDKSKQEEIIKNWNISAEYREYTLEPTKKVSKLVQNYSRDTMIALDAGCGSGAYTRFFNSKEIICLDLVPFFLKKIRSGYKGNSKLHFIISDVVHLPFKKKCVDFVFCSSVLEHLDKKVTYDVVKNFSKTCKKVVLMDVPNDSSYIVLLFRDFFTKMGFYRGRIENITDEKLEHHSQFSVSDLEKMGFNVHGCIGWVSRKNIKIGALWDLYDFFAWINPSVGGTLIGIKHVD